MKPIMIKGAKAGNLKNISLEIPRNKLVVLTGLSGSGKSTLATDVLFNECQRQYLEAIGLQGINKPNVESISHIAPAILITQNQSNKNPRSSVGTMTNIYTDLRMIYEKLSRRICPKCHQEIASSECKEEVERQDNDFKVYMYCKYCHERMPKLTRTEFSFNTKEGACIACEGLGKVLSIKHEAVIDESKSLEEGSIVFWEQKYKEYQISALYKAFRHYNVPIKEGTPVKQFSQAQKALLMYGVESEQVKALFPEVEVPKTVAGGKFEGAYTTLWRRMKEKDEESDALSPYFEEGICPECKGERLNALSRSVTVGGKRLPELVSLSLEVLYQWIQELEQSLIATNRELVQDYLTDLKTKLRRLLHVGIGYLTLDRTMNTLSGGESQRIKLAAALDSDLTGIIYIMDEPTIGLHPQDTEGIIKVLKALRDKGNTVIIIEHDVDVMKEADYIIDIGPGAGKYGGEVIGQGTLEELKMQKSSVTGMYLQAAKGNYETFRPGKGTFIEVKGANLHNLKHIDVRFPIGCLTSVTGVSGSGKSTLVFDILADPKAIQNTHFNRVIGTECFDHIITVEQAPLTKMKRSNVATYSGVYSEIRKIFGGLEEAKKKGLNTKHFSFNSKGGRCENCEGLGYVTNNMLFFRDLEVTCPICHGNQFKDEVLAIKYKGYSIKEVLKMSIEEAMLLFKEEAKVMRILEMLKDVGLAYLELGQTVTTLSGGEGQRLKLAKELIENKGKQNLYLIDEPTTGLHPIDVENFLKLLNHIVDSGSTVIVVEHNQQVIKASDWIIDLGLEGGDNGGEVIVTGTPREIIAHKHSVTGRFL
ncbi:MAG: excinuclease ABC subunit UvrA [Candidatus Niameybacter stercoravium]|nr:excinuclease ABC subunit UvrA [Candidatus Niameybacter stercoravium]